MLIANPQHPSILRSISRPSDIQVPPGDLSLPEAYNLLAALMQFPGMALLCVAIYMQNWVWLEPKETHLGSQPTVSYTFGLPYMMNTSRNGSENVYFFHKERPVLKLIVITVCFLNLCFGVAAFLLAYLDFQMVEKSRTLVSSLHIFSGTTMMVLLASIWCFKKLSQWLMEPEQEKHPMVVHFGESFYIGLLAFSCAFWAVVFTLCSIRLSSKLKMPNEAPDAK